ELVDDRADLASTLCKVLCLVGLDRGERSRAGDGAARVGATEATGMSRIHDLGATGDGRQREATRNALRRGHDVCDDTLVVRREQIAGAGEAGLHLIENEDDVVLGCPLAQRGKEALGG